MMYGPNKITATMKLVATAEFYDDEATEETLRYCVEQDLEDAGFEVDVSLLKEQEPKRAEWSTGRAHCPSCGELFPKKKDMTLYTRFCSFCGQKVKWE